MAGLSKKQLQTDIAGALGVSNAKAKQIVDAFESQVVQPLSMQLNLRGIRQLLSRKNPYLYRASGIATCEDLVDRAFGDYLSSSTETLFGNFLEGAAIAVSGASKSSTQGIDIERTKANGSRELYVLKSGPAGFNSASLRDAERALQAAEGLLRQGGVTADKSIAFTYGRKKTTFIRGISRLSSREFWQRLGGSEDFYVKLLDCCARLAPLYRADIAKARPRLLREAKDIFCHGTSIDWSAVLEAASG